MGLNAGASLKDKLETGVVECCGACDEVTGEEGLARVTSENCGFAAKFHDDDMSPSSGYGRVSISLAVRPIRSTTQIRVITCHQYGKSTFVPQTSFRGSVGCFLNFLLQAYLLRLSPLLRPPNFHST